MTNEVAGIQAWTKGSDERTAGLRADTVELARGVQMSIEKIELGQR